ncbi:glycosyl transferase group 1 [Pseudopedobacter saltans DSM 12145]|uniref:Glycosyl transferase group 1 n=1 Tax=Pseudopedobacter saltans (strain ATCC 51119 / DSM 12145 / JCM 21818 / CCUG 39354 / LMG 10337 / NBRC 100064 / NCIMB 13643) TaxID=762903 RepID=F0SCH2_PSESL|nr:glycosyltransferase family 1 protein [Pseudopedobacter saltans]ADY52806.1 glycosyl transferase group 1 [Pseudopedobacter saltans DSM 12145]
MNIGFEAKRVFRNFTGLGNYSRAVVKALSENYPDNRYFLYTPDNKGSLNTSLNLKAPNISIVTAPVKALKAIWRVLQINKNLKEDKIDLFHGLSNELPLNIRKSKVPAVVTIHDLIFIRYPQYFKLIDRNIYKYKFRKACINANRIIAISEQTKRDIIHFFKIDPHKIDIVYQGCDPVFSIPTVREDLQIIKHKYSLPDSFLLCVGTIEQRKNQLLILQALNQIPEDIKLVLVGKPTAYKTELTTYIQTYNLENRVHFLEKVPFQDLPLIYQLANIFVYPSRFEGFGIPLLEAISAGVPAIGATGSCLEEAGGPDSLYTYPDNHNELAKYINMVLQSDELRQKMIEKGLQYASKFSEENIARNLMNVYKKTLENA